MFWRAGPKKPRSKSKSDLIIFSACLAIAIGFFYSITKNNHSEIPRTSTIIAQVKAYEAVLQSFYESFHFYAGDIKDASHVHACGINCNPASAFANDGVIGSLDFGKTLKHPISRTTVPASSASDETVLFWQHLLKADLISGVTDAGLKDAQTLTWGLTHPSARLGGGGFIVGSSDGAPFPFSPYSSGMRGIILVQTMDPTGNLPLDAETKQPLSPKRAAQIDRKMDDGKPNTGLVQAYGAPTCFIVDEEEKTAAYNESNPKKDCGLIYKIGELSPKTPVRPAD